MPLGGPHSRFEIFVCVSCGALGDFIESHGENQGRTMALATVVYAGYRQWVTMSVLFCPPKPMLLDIAKSTLAFRGLLGM